MPIIHNTSASIRRLDLRLAQRRHNSTFFNRVECNTFISSPLAMQCEELLIRIRSSLNIIIVYVNQWILLIFLTRDQLKRSSTGYEISYL
jgi:hypothetical protein